MRTKRRKDYFELAMAKERKRTYQKSRALGFPDSVRIVLNGRTIEHTPKRLGEDFALRMGRYFWDHLKTVICDPSGFVFLGFGGAMTAPHWVEFHEVRLKAEFKGLFQLMDGERILDQFSTT